jgi:hypothetical protein
VPKKEKMKFFFYDIVHSFFYFSQERFMDLNQFFSENFLKESLIDGIREPVSGSLLYGNNIISGAVVPTSNAIGLHGVKCRIVVSETLWFSCNDFARNVYNPKWIAGIFIVLWKCIKPSQEKMKSLYY